MTLMATKKCPKCQEEKLIVEFASPICAPCCKPDAELELCRYRVKIAKLERALKMTNELVQLMCMPGCSHEGNCGSHWDQARVLEEECQSAQQQAEAYQVMSMWQPPPQCTKNSWCVMGNAPHDKCFRGLGG